MKTCSNIQMTTVLGYCWTAICLECLEISRIWVTVPFLPSPFKEGNLEVSSPLHYCNIAIIIIISATFVPRKIFQYLQSLSGTFLGNVCLFEVNNRNRRNMWNIVYFNNKDTRMSSFFFVIVNSEHFLYLFLVLLVFHLFTLKR